MKRICILFLAFFFFYSCTSKEEQPVQPKQTWNDVFAPSPAEVLLERSLESSGPGVHRVKIVGMKFEPEVMSLKAGDTILWINKDIFAHDITESESQLWKSGKLEPGQTWAMIPQKSSDYFCSIHVVMKGKIVFQ